MFSSKLLARESDLTIVVEVVHEGGTNMKCPKCGSTNVTVNVIQQTKLVDKHHGIIW